LAFQQIVIYVQNVEMMVMAIMFLKEAKWTLHGLYENMRG
jgi:hypothetical protein